MNFNKERFANFAKYDLTINKAFYRNIALVTIAGAISVALIGFMARYSIYTNMQYDSMSDIYRDVDPYAFEGYNWVYFTAAYEIGFLFIMMQIFAGCWAHNLRNKQGRITELTLPSTNLEKFTWHALLMLVGGFIACTVSLLIADGLNALLTLITYGAEDGIASLSAAIGDIYTVRGFIENVILRSTPFGVGLHDNSPAVRAYQAMTFMIVCGSISQVFVYFLGNALKYKYNIILTYICLQVISTILSILFFIGSATLSSIPTFMELSADTTETDPVNIVTLWSYILGGFALILAFVFIWWSYNRYTKAQITSPFNK